MSWRYTQATIHGDKTDPVPGDSVDIVLTNPDTTPPGSVVLTWVFDGTQTRAEFVNMVRGEIRAHLAHLNIPVVEDDATVLFIP